MTTSPLSFEQWQVEAIQSAIDKTLASSLGILTSEQDALMILEALEHEGVTLSAGADEQTDKVIKSHQGAMVRVSIDIAALADRTPKSVKTVLDDLKVRGLI